jgi:PAS domain S-box-containing protein
LCFYQPDGRVLLVNREFERLIGWRTEDLQERDVMELCYPDPEYREGVWQYMMEAEPGWQDFVVTTRNADQLESSWANVRLPDGSQVGIGIDIRERKQAERQMEEARIYAESIIETIEEALVVLDAQLRVISANHTFYESFSLSPEQAEGQYIYQLSQEQLNVPRLRHLLEGILPGNTSFENLELEANLPAAGRRTLLLNARRIYKTKRETQMILLAMQDITVRKQQERRILEDQKELRSLTEELLMAEERQRREVATILHDSIGQALAFSKRELGSLLKDISGDNAEALKRIRDEISQIIRQSRTLTWNLSPPTLETFGLGAGLEELAEQFSNEQGIRCTFEDDEADKPLTEQIRILLYRSVYELLTNAAKHAEPEHIEICCRREDEQICITVHDDGRGFRTSHIGSKATRDKKFGLFSIRERLTHVGGSFNIESRQGEGTTVRLRAPLEVANQRSGDAER